MEYEELCLKNGVKLYVLPLPHVQTVALGVHVNVGTRDEIWPREAGLAHALEHMVFQGTEEFPDSRSVSEYLESIGGMLNAFTWQEMTFYFNRLPCVEKERGFRILSQQLQKSLFLPEKIPPEMQNIVQEIHRANDNPPSFLEDRAYKVFYGEHPLGKRTLGLEESVTGFVREDFQNFLNKFYYLSNFTFVAAGNIKPKEAKKFFERHFPESTEKPRSERGFLKIFTTPRDTIIQKEVEQAHMFLGATTCSSLDRDSLILNIFKIMIGGGMSFPLFQEVRDKRGLCYEIKADYHSWSDVGLFSIYLGTDYKRKEEAKSAVVEVIQNSKKSQNLLERAKLFVKGRIAFAFEDAGNIIKNAGFDITFRGRPKSYKEKINEVQSITIKEVEKVVDLYLSSERLTEVSLVPKSE